MTDNIPRATWEGTFTLGGFTLRCYVLDDGRRIIDANDMIGFFEHIGKSEAYIDEADLEAFVLWAKRR